jgi:hypothetical protein
MIKKTQIKKNNKLTLNHETLRELTLKDVALIAGGFGRTAHCGTSGKLSDCGCATE